MERCWLVLSSLAVAGCTTVFDIDATGLAPASDNPRTLLLNNSASRVDLVEFPLLVVLDAQRIDYTRVGSPATELRFQMGTQDLPFEIESWNPAGQSHLWVRVPRITAGSTTETIEMYFGADAAGAEQARDVWTSYDLVLHGKPGAIASPTPSGYVGVPTGVTNAPGVIASAYQFVDDDNQRTIELPAELLDGWPSYSLEMWLYLDYASSEGYRNGFAFQEPSLLSKNRPVPTDGLPLSGGRVFWAFIDFLFTAQIDLSYASGDAPYVNTILRLRRWSHITLTFDGQTQWFFRDGDFADVNTFDMPTMLEPGPGTLVLGGLNHAINGMIDEIRVSRVFRDPDWVQAQFLSMSDRFITYPLPGELR